MFTNYLKIALRHAAKQKLYAFINIFGLAVGMAFCVLIFLYVRDELTFDRFHENGDRIYRVTQQSLTPDGGVESEVPWQSMPLAGALRADLPEVEHTVRLMEHNLLVRTGPTTIEETVLFADPSIFDVFSFPLRQGDPATALDDLNGIVLSERAARTFFGDADPMGQSLQVRFDDAFHDVVVTGVARPVPGNSSIRFDLLMPFDKLPAAYTWIRNRTDRWNLSSFFVYALLKEGASGEAVDAKLPAFRARYLPDETANLREEGRWEGEGPARTFHLQPLAEIHLDPHVLSGLTPPSDPTYSYTLAGIALAILLIACINFTTLAIGRSAGRAREVGVRKVVGAQRGQLMAQFWGEALLMTLVAVGVGLALAELFLPTFNILADKSLQLDYADQGLTLAVLLGLMLGTGLLAGSYPALVLSGVRPVDTLRRRLRLGGANALTKTLVVAQFVPSIFLIIGTLAMVQQLDYLQRKNLGFNQEHVVVVPVQDLPGDTVLERFEQEVGRRPDVRGITAASSSFTRGYSREGWTYRGEAKSAYTYRVAPDYLDVLEIDLVAGRAFDPARVADMKKAVLVNEALVRDFGWEEPVGQELTGFYDDPVVVGVFRDVHFLSLRQSVEPMVLTTDPDWGFGHVLVRVAPDDVPGTLSVLETAWRQIAPEIPFQYSFLDEDLNRQYVSEQRWSRIVGYGAVFAVLIACLGLFGLAALTVAGRTKEVGIRKVLGATVSGVTVLLSKDFVRLVAAAVVLAAPAAYFAVEQWLDGFAYRITLSWKIFALAGLVALGVALAAVAYQALKAALANPVKTLRYE